MSTKMDGEIKRWFARRKGVMVLSIIWGKVTVSEAGRLYDLSPPRWRSGSGDAKRGMENALWANSLDIKGQYERQIKGLQEIYGEAMLELRAKKCSLCWVKTRNDRDDAPGTGGRWLTVSIAKLCQWLSIPRRTVYYKPIKAVPKVDPKFA